MTTPSTAPRGLGRVRASVAYRSSEVYRALARYLPVGRVAPKPAMDLNFLTFGGAAHLGMIRETLLTLARSWPALPRVTVATDGTLPPATALASLSWWPGPALRVVPWSDLIDPIVQRHPDVGRFGARDAMGKKMAAVAALSLESEVLYADVDILWLAEPSTLNVVRKGTAPRLAMSTDIMGSYDSRLVPEVLPELANPPYFCAGLLYARGDIIEAGHVGELLRFAAEQGIGVTEQTIFAEANRRLGGERFSLDEIALFDSDRFTLAPSVRGARWAARHYVGQVRHLYWRDAMALRRSGRHRPA